MCFRLLSILKLLELEYILLKSCMIWEVLSALLDKHFQRRLNNLQWLTVNCCWSSVHLIKRLSFGGFGNLAFSQTSDWKSRSLWTLFVFGSRTILDWLPITNTESNIQHLIIQTEMDVRSKKRPRSWKVFSHFF